MRAITAAEADDVASLWVAAGLVQSVDGRREEILTKLTRDPELFIVADDGGRLVGTAMGTWDGHRGWIKRVAVDPAWQRRGLATAMVVELERRFLAMGVTRLRLAMWEGNEAARGFWASLGWQEHPDVLYAIRDLVEPAVEAEAVGDAC